MFSSSLVSSAASGVDALGRHRQVKVLSGFQPRALLEDRLQDLARRARPGRRLEDHHLPALEHRRKAPAGALDVGKIRLALAGERRRQRDQDRVSLLDLRVVVRRDDEALLGECGEPFRADVLDVALAAVQRVDDGLLHVDEEDAVASLPEGGGKGDTDVPRADDGDVVEALLGHAAQGYRAAATRSAAWPSP